MKTPGLNTTVSDPPDAEQGAPLKSRIAFASAWAPSAGRRQWLAVYRCPRCGGGHAARAATLTAITGGRRGRCGRRVWVVIARTYGGTE